jgi:hypothetical protein
MGQSVKPSFQKSSEVLPQPLQAADDLEGQVLDGLDVQKHQIGQDKQPVPRTEALALADTGASQMALDMQHGKQFLEPQFQIGTEIYQSRFDLPWKTSDLSIMQREAAFMRF